jgi:hypothetical protein
MVENAYLAAQVGDVGVGVEGTANGFLDCVHDDCRVCSLCVWEAIVSRQVYGSPSSPSEVYEVVGIMVYDPRACLHGVVIMNTRSACVGWHLQYGGKWRRLLTP